MDIKTSNKLYELRKAKGYSQDELADLLNVSRQAVSKWERAESSPDTDNLIALAKLYDISIDDLLDYKPNNKFNADEENRTKNNDGNSEENAESDFHCKFDNSTDQKAENDDNSNEYHCDFDADNTCDPDDVLDNDFPDDDENKNRYIRIDSNGVFVRVRESDKDDYDEYKVKFDENGCHVHVRESDDDKKGYTEKHIFKSFDDDKSPKPLIPHVASVAINSSIIILSVIAYLLLGILGGWWHPAWIVFLAIPIFSGMLDAISKRNPNNFPFAVLVTALYLLLGFLGGWWHPAWIAFLFIPVYHILAEALYKAHKKKADDCQNKDKSI